MGQGTMRGHVSAALRRFAPIGACVTVCLLLAQCSNAPSIDPRYGVTASPRVVSLDQPIPKGGGSYRVGAPYTVGGRVYVPEADSRYRATGLASWYGEDFRGRYTANGEIFDTDGISAAHPTLPLPSYVRVTNLANSRSLIVRVNDRGPYHGNRIIDVSGRAAHLLGFRHRGTAWVRVEYVGRAPMAGSDDRVLAATLRQNAPAPAPWDVKLAATSLIPPLPNQPPPVRHPHLASVLMTDDAASDPPTTSAVPVDEVGSRGTDGTDQFLNGRGLY